ncbi:tnp_zf-ribbon_2 domain-containing protein [Trichonephila inaurata madagascariensis]|uniref:Tnp_zf-ribbon_2 domain-containing protein n=1 Tax=Trichonephila inaurata madagascariensis TaxID=2747483 RepID=A0A8X7C163_9ARAC|nr:tnp_zf-ribbon_2 domain-containing protein [Trichonephila inaurata madagascariensis]
MAIVNSYILWSLMHGEKTPYYNNLKSFWLDLITGLVSIGHQKFPEKRFASNSYSGPVKLKFKKHTVSEKDRLKNVGHIPTKCKSRRCTYYSTRVKPHRTRWMCPNCDVGLCMIAKSNDNSKNSISKNFTMEMIFLNFLHI